MLFGDCLFAQALKLAASFPTPEICRAVAMATNTVCSGEILQTQHRRNFDLPRTEYFRVLEMKTAELFALSCELAAHLSGAARRRPRHVAPVRPRLWHRLPALRRLHRPVRLRGHGWKIARDRSRQGKTDPAGAVAVGTRERRGPRPPGVSNPKLAAKARWPKWPLCCPTTTPSPRPWNASTTTWRRPTRDCAACLNPRDAPVCCR